VVVAVEVVVLVVVGPVTVEVVVAVVVDPGNVLVVVVVVVGPVTVCVVVVVVAGRVVVFVETEVTVVVGPVIVVVGPVTVVVVVDVDVTVVTWGRHGLGNGPLARVPGVRKVGVPYWASLPKSLLVEPEMSFPNVNRQEGPVPDWA
jgi:hypothetical protein